MKRPTPPDARGVGTISKTYPKMQEKDLFSFEFVILVSVTPIKGLFTRGWGTPGR